MSDPVRDPRFLENEVALWADALIHALVETLAEQMTCSEAEATADLFRAIGQDEDAGNIIEAHAYGDSEASDAHHDIYLTLHEEVTA